MSQKWNLQDIRPAKQARRRGAVIERAERINNSPASDTPDSATTRRNSESVGRIEVADGRNRKSWTAIISISIFILIVAGGFVMSAFLAGAEITVNPKHRTPNVNAIFTSNQTPAPDALNHEILIIEASGERQVTATGESEVQEPATGEIEIFKTTPGAQRLIKNTRFESADGLVYRITETAIVPGAVTAANGTSVPGSIRAEVFSDGTGQEYNLAQGTRFTIPGLESDEALFTAMYATNNQPFMGGFDGPKFTIDEGELETATQALRIELRDSLLAQLSEQKPANFIVFDDAVAFTYTSLPAVEYGDNLVTIKERAKLSIPVFQATDFASFIAAATIPGYEGLPVRIDNPSDLTFSYTVATTSAIDLTIKESLTFKLAGKPHIVWTYDAGKLATDIIGKAKTALPTVLGGYPAIERAEAVVRPFWKQSFPDDLDEITITEMLTENSQ